MGGEQSHVRMACTPLLQSKRSPSTMQTKSSHRKYKTSSGLKRSKSTKSKTPNLGVESWAAETSYYWLLALKSCVSEKLLCSMWWSPPMLSEVRMNELVKSCFDHAIESLSARTTTHRNLSIDLAAHWRTCIARSGQLLILVKFSAQNFE